MQGTNDNRTSKTSSLRPGHVRTVALAATIVGVVVLPIAAANANPLHSSTKQSSATGAPSTGSPATATALLPQFCGTTETGFGGQVTEQTCVNDSDGVVTGTAFVANSSAKTLTVGINLTRADGSLANMTCTVVAHDADGECTTGPLSFSAGKGAFNAIAETAPTTGPLADGVLRAQSGEVTPTAGTAASAAPSTSTAPSATAATPTTAASTAPTATASATASSSAS